MHLKHILIYILCHMALASTGQENCINHWETIIHPENTWKYVVDSTFQEDDWESLDFDDSQWNQGKGGIGYGDDDDATIIANCKILYLRQKFEIGDINLICKALLSIDYDDAFVAYLNGAEVARSGLSDPIPEVNSFVELHEAKMYSGGHPENYSIELDTLLKYLNPGENLLSFQIHNESVNSSDLTSIIFFSVAVSTADQLYGPIADEIVLPISNTTPFDIPLVSIETNGQAINKWVKITADMKIIDNGDGKFNYLSDEGNEYAGKIAIKVRGSSSAGFPQKSYRLETRYNDGENRNVPLLNLPSENDWLLISNYYDRSFVRNFLSHEIFRGMGHYSPRMRYCEVVINGEYKGIYLLIEKIKVDKARVDIARLGPDENTGDDVTGGYIIKNDNYEPDGSDSWVVNFPMIEELSWTEVQARLVYVYPDWDIITPQQKSYIKGFIETSKNILYGDDFLDPENGYQAFFDVRSFVDYFLISEISRNGDAYKKSRFFYKDKESNGGLLHAGPPWDFDWAWKNLFFQSNDGSGWTHSYEAYGYSDVQPVRFVNKMLLDPYFANETFERYFDLRKTVLHYDTLINKIDSVANYLSNAQVRHFEQWDILNNTSGDPDTHIPESFDDEIDYLKSWISLRMAWLDENMVIFEREIAPIVIKDSTILSISDVSNIDLRIYPNPATDNIYVESDVIMNQVELMDAAGNVLISKDVHQSNSFFLNIQALTPGLYMITIVTPNHKLIRRILRI